MTNNGTVGVNSTALPITPPNYSDVVAAGGLQSPNIKTLLTSGIAETEMDKATSFNDPNIPEKY